MPLDIYNGIVRLAGDPVQHSGVGFSGKVFIFYGIDRNDATSGSYSGDFKYSIGFATISGPGGAGRYHVVGYRSLDNEGTSIVASRLDSSGCIGYVNNSGQQVLSYHLASGDGDGFTLARDNFTSAEVSVSGLIGVTVIGGDDLTNYTIVRNDNHSGHGTVEYFGGGLFSSGTLAFSLAGGTSGGYNIGQQHGYMTFGMATNSGFQGCVSVFSRHNSTAGNANRWPRSNRFFTNMNFSGVERAIARFDGFTASGCDITWISGDLNSNEGWSMLVMKISGNQKVINWDSISGTGNQDVTGLGFSGKFAMFLTSDISINNFLDSSEENRFSIGTAMSASNQIGLWAGDNDGPTITQSSRAMSTGNCMWAAIPDSSASASGTFVADFTSFNADGFSVNKSENAFNGTTSGMTWITLVMGEIATPEVEPFLPGINARPMHFGGRHPGNYGIPSNPIFGN